MRVLVSGGAGYIGSHMALVLAEAGYEITIVDNCSTGHRGAVDAVRLAVASASIVFEECSLDERDRIAALMTERRIEAVIHFAARASIAESCEHPLQYWSTNVGATVALLEAMQIATVQRLIFSSTCATYGVADGACTGIDESSPQHPINPYGASKVAAERAIRDFQHANHRGGGSFAAATLRYFNVVGSDPAGRIGEVHDPEHHLVPSCLLAALGRRSAIEIFGEDHPTSDGTCIRDYVDVSDVCAAHLAALHHLRDGSEITLNVGAGRGHSVREVVRACERVSQCEIPTRTAARREGDPAKLIANTREINRLLGWTPLRSLDDSIASAWRWLKANPAGYAEVKRES